MAQREQTGVTESAHELLTLAGDLPCYGVVGNPIAHSLSPELHTSFAQQFGDEICYRRLLLAPEKFDHEVRVFFEQGGCGLNVTVPFKAQAYDLCDALTADARQAGAVNTLWMVSDKLWGDNTDGGGLVQDLTGRCKLSLTDMQVLILGAGGAVKGVIAPLFNAGVAGVTIANRTRTKADALVKQFSKLGDIQAIDAGAPVAPTDAFSGFDLIIQGTGAGLSQDLPALDASWFGPHTACYDMMYASQPTPFLAVSAERFAVQQAWDGLGMLLEQAALAFSRWRGQVPQTAPVMNQLRPDAL